MYCIDFEYDGRRLSDYGCMVCHITSSPDLDTISMGSQITFNTINRIKQNQFKIMSAQYDEAYTTTFEIGKFYCQDRNEYTFTQEEISWLMRWLNKRTYRKFKMIYKDGECANIYYMGSFNAKMIVNGDNIVGLELTLQTDAPFGYYEPIDCNMRLGGGSSATIYDISDEAGYIYPNDVEITCLSGGDLIINNSQDEPRSVVIKNCVAGEVIKMDGENKIITSSVNHKKLYNDFNYNYIRIANKNAGGVDETKNTFTASIPCNIKFTYSPACKMGIV